MTEETKPTSEAANAGSVRVDAWVRRNQSCSFCGKHATEVEWLLKGENALICNECVEAGMRHIILLREKKEREAVDA